VCPCFARDAGDAESQGGAVPISLESPHDLALSEAHADLVAERGEYGLPEVWRRPALTSSA